MDIEKSIERDIEAAKKQGDPTLVEDLLKIQAIVEKNKNARAAKKPRKLTRRELDTLNAARQRRDHLLRPND